MTPPFGKFIANDFLLTFSFRFDIFFFLHLMNNSITTFQPCNGLIHASLWLHESKWVLQARDDDDGGGGGGNEHRKHFSHHCEAEICRRVFM